MNCSCLTEKAISGPSVEETSRLASRLATWFRSGPATSVRTTTSDTDGQHCAFFLHRKKRAQPTCDDLKSAATNLQIPRKQHQNQTVRN